MDWTDVHFRQLVRLISKHTWLWTEMVVDKTIIHTGHLDRHLWFPPEQHPIVLQVGGSDPDALREAAAKAVAYGYDEVNLNCGCPSDRVAGAGCFGASLMLNPQLVARCMQALAEGLQGTPVTVKCRLGVDDVDEYASLHRFVQVVSTSAPVGHFIVHSRKCLLRGFSPAQNRTVPPLRYHWVVALKRDFPHLDFTINGGFQGAAEAAAVLRYEGPSGERFHGVMLGRAAYSAPWACLAQADTKVFGASCDAAPSRREVLREYCVYADDMLGKWQVKEDGHKHPNVRAMVRPLLNLFHGEPRCKKWKTEIDKVLLRKPPPATVSAVVDATLHIMDDSVLDAPPSEAKAAHEMFAAEQTGEWPPTHLPALEHVLAVSHGQVQELLSV